MEWISVKDRLPELHTMVALMDVTRYANNGNVQVDNEHVVQAGFLDEFGSKHWSLYGERALVLGAFTHWSKLDLPPKEN